MFRCWTFIQLFLTSQWLNLLKKTLFLFLAEFAFSQEGRGKKFLLGAVKDELARVDVCVYMYSIDKTKALSLVVHCADISHPSKAWNLHHRWTELLIEEFFRQVSKNMCATRSRLSSAGGSCGRQTAGHSSCRAQGPRSVGGTLPWLARPLGRASPSTCGLHHCPEIHLRKKT